jgi:predicted enzyme related to lactoylglutathione lyase
LAAAGLAGPVISMATKTSKGKTSKRGKPSKTSRPAAPKSANGAKKAAPKKSAGTTMAERKVRPGGFISHTELASTDPDATRTWAEEAFGWKFMTMPTPNGPYHMWRFAENQGGGIRSNNPPESPGSIPYVEVADIKRSFDKAVKAGGTPMMPPEEIEGGMGWIAIVQAPGGPAVGLWGPPTK